MKLNTTETIKKGIEYCDKRQNNCTTCPLVHRVCISSPYGLFLLKDRALDFKEFTKDFKFMISEIYEEDKDGNER